MSQRTICSHHHEGEATQQACVSLVPIFNYLEDEQLYEIMEVVRGVSYKKGEILYHPGDPSDALYIVNRGKIKIYRLSESGKEQMIRMLHPGDFTGELALFQQSVHEAYAEAIVDTEICQIRRDDLQRLLLTYPTISLKILKEFANRLEGSEKQTTRFATEKVETRIALFLAEYADDQAKTVVTLPMSKKDLASYLGTTPETLSRKLTEFEEQGLIEQKGQRKIKINDLDALLLI